MLTGTMRPLAFQIEAQFVLCYVTKAQDLRSLRRFWVGQALSPANPRAQCMFLGCSWLV